MTWRGIFVNNLGWKLFSLLIALIVWNTYHLTGGSILFTNWSGDTKSANYVGFRPRILTRQGETRRFRLKPEQVEITISGLPADIDRLEVKDILAYVDMQDYKEGDTNAVPVHVMVGQHLTVTDIQPSKVQVERVPDEFRPTD